MSENPLDRALSSLDSEEQRRSDEREGGSVPRLNTASRYKTS